VTLQQRSTSSANVQANQSHNHDNHHHNTATTRPSAPIVSVATVGQLLKIPTTTLLRILDPILTFGTFQTFIAFANLRWFVGLNLNILLLLNLFQTNAKNYVTEYVYTVLQFRRPPLVCCNARSLCTRQSKNPILWYHRPQYGRSHCVLISTITTTTTTWCYPRAFLH
jgi:hypothetical protein